MSSETPRKHHYIPTFYLKQWAGADEQVCEYRQVRPGKIVSRRTAPDGTGYQRDLYRVDAAPDVLSPEIESTFMRLVDTGASLALQEFLQSNGRALSGRMRSDWTRFILSLQFRTPEVVSFIKRRMTDLSKACFDDRAHTERDMPQKAALKLLTEIIDNDRVGPIIYDMQWSLARLTRSRISLLTSDRPIDRPHGLGNGDAYIALPIGPELLFLAAHDDACQKCVASTDQTRIVKAINRAVVQCAREFVWGCDDSQYRFVHNRMSRSPDRQIITDEQGQRAIDAAGAVHSALRATTDRR
jgi:hypothetical protein